MAHDKSLAALFCLLAFLLCGLIYGLNRGASAVVAVDASALTPAELAALCAQQEEALTLHQEQLTELIRGYYLGEISAEQREELKALIDRVETERRQLETNLQILEQMLAAPAADGPAAETP